VVIAGRYSLDREIGRGGMGAVWLGTDEVLGREVALKRIGLMPGLDSTDLARAEREARLAARLSHPNVVAIFNLVVDGETGARWLVMEYVDGPTLGQLVHEEGPLSPDEAAPLLRQSADALAAAHAAGIVHRDVKPSNILVDRRRHVKLTDFGIAHVATDASLTQTGLITGSPAYVAPEVAAGRRGDEAADVWSLGATIFHVLSGHPPYDIGDNVLGGLYRIVNEDPPRLAAGWMTPLLDATLVKDPQRRWTMSQVRDFLSRPPRRAPGAGRPAPDEATQPFVPVHEAADETEDETEDEPTRVAAPVAAAAEPPAPPPRPTRSPRRVAQSSVAIALVGLALAVVVGLVIVVALPHRSGSPDDRAGGTTGTAATGPSPSPSRSAAPSKPTAAGMESFIRDYVSAVSSDPGRAWHMLTPKFQQESGGLAKYTNFWDGVGTGQVRDIAADPDRLVVSYHVKFDNFGTGKRPTVLDLVYSHGRYRIDGERTQGFQAAGADG
jgi:serine/threonine protein kinase